MRPYQTVNTASRRTIIVISFATLLVVLNVLRIFNVSITHDETGYRPGTYMDAFMNFSGSANSHLLHSVIRKVLVETFNDSLFFLRVDSLLAQLLFLFYSWRLCDRLFGHTWRSVAAFILLNISCPLLFEFWGLSRGYALANALMITSVYWLTCYLDKRELNPLTFCLGAGILSVYANFALIDYFVALVIILIGLIVFHNKEKRRDIATVLAGCLLLTGLIYVPLTNVFRNGELQYLGNTGFIENTITSLAQEGILQANSRPITVSILVYGSLLFAVFAGLYWSALVYRYRKDTVPAEIRRGMILYLLSVIPACSTIVQFQLCNINYLIDRAALFMIVLFVIHGLYWLSYVFVSYRRALSSILAILLMAAGYNFATNASIYGTRLWWYDRDDMRVLERIAAQQKDNPAKIRIWVTWMQTPAFNYYVTHFYQDRFSPIEHQSDPAGNDTSYDYYYLGASETPALSVIYKRDTQFVFGGFALCRK